MTSTMSFGSPKIDFGKKSSNLEQSIQRIKVRKSLLMAQICLSDKPDFTSKVENNNQQSEKVTDRF